MVKEKAQSVKWPKPNPISTIKEWSNKKPWYLSPNSRKHTFRSAFLIFMIFLAYSLFSVRFASLWHKQMYVNDNHLHIGHFFSRSPLLLHLFNFDRVKWCSATLTRVWLGPHRCISAALGRFPHPTRADAARCGGRDFSAPHRYSGRCGRFWQLWMK